MPMKSSHLLISRTDNIGDVVLTLPIAARIKQYDPSIKISFLCRAYAAPIVRCCDDVDEVVEYESVTDNLVDFFRKSDIDTVIIAQPNQHIAKSAFLAGVRHRIGNAKQKLYLLLFCNRRVRFNKRDSDDHEAQFNFAFLRPYGIEEIPSRQDIPSLYHFSIEKDPRIAGLFSSYTHNLVFHVKSNGSGREWPLGHYIKLAALLEQHTGVHIWLTGSGKEGQWVNAHAPGLLHAPNVTGLYGRQTLTELIALINQSDGLIASGTGPLHIAAAIGQRCIGLFPPTRPAHPGRWAALGRQAVSLSISVCPNPACAEKKEPTCDCMEAITPEQVYAIVLQWFAELGDKAVNVDKGDVDVIDSR